MDHWKTNGTRLLRGITLAAVMMGAGMKALAIEPGAAAPSFELKSVKGESVSLEALKGKIVVLEWSNPDCPFVKKHYGSGNMQKLQADYTAKGVIWLTINSSASGKQGYYPASELAQKLSSQGSKATQVLQDSDGKVGHAYEAKTTPHMIVIAQDGTVAYNGAIDSTPSPNPADIATSKNYVAQALNELLAGKPVTEKKTQPYGCGVKYAQ
jgi:AhpC/TSA family